MRTIFMTGFPGFLGVELARRLLQRLPPETVLVCLVQERFLPLAKRRQQELTGNASEKLKLIPGDITLPNLGLGDNQPELVSSTVEIYHLAALYDLGTQRERARRINVEGTHHVLAFAGACPHLERMHYVSTCYVSGRHPGVFAEGDLNVGQEFNNFYEETKFLAEMEVQEAMAGGMPGTIYRPAIVVGDSRSGATQKYDGPYFVLQWLLRQPRLAILPTVGHPHRTDLNVVPRDFVVNAIDYLSTLSSSAGRVYQLCDPHPLSIDGMVTALGEASGRRVLRLPLPRSVAKSALKYIPGVYRLLRIEPASVDYFVHPTRYLCANTLTDLAGSGIACPSFRSYVKPLVDFMRNHPEFSSEAMV